MLQTCTTTFFYSQLPKDQLTWGRYKIKSMTASQEARVSY